MLLQKLTDAGIRPNIQRLDHEASGTFTAILQRQNIDFDFTATWQHRHSPSLVAGRYTTNLNVALRHWDLLLLLAGTAFNLLRYSRRPLRPRAIVRPLRLQPNADAPSGCQEIEYSDPETRNSWDLRGTKGWSFGPVLEHCRC